MADSDFVKAFNGSLGLGKESTEGTPVVATVWFDAQSESFRIDYEREDFGGLRGERQAMDNAVVLTRRNGQGGFMCHPRLENLQTLLECCLGSDLNGSDEILVAQTLPGFTTEVDVAGVSGHRFAGCKVNTWTVRSQANQPLEIDIDALLRSRADMDPVTTPDYSAWSDQKPIMHDELSISAGPAYVPSGQIASVEISGNNNLDGDQFYNNLDRIAAPAGPLEVSGQVVVPWNSTTKALLAALAAEAPVLLTFKWARRGDAGKYLQLDVNARYRGEYPPQVGSKDETTQLTIPFIGVKDASYDAVKATLVTS